jgi:hypothetical protein
MRLSTAAGFFDRTLCADAFDATKTFYAQLDIFDDSKRDGATVVRRVLSVKPSVTLPARRVLTIDGVQWMVGQNQDDHFNGEAVRRKYVVQRADGAATIQTVSQALAASGGTATYGAKLWIKDLKEVEISSKLAPFFNVYLPSPEAPNVGELITLVGRLNMVRGLYRSAAGFLVAEASELDAAAIASATYSTQSSYSPATDSYTPSNTAVNVLQIRFQDDYSYTSEAEPKFVEGDIKAYVRKTQVTTAKAGDTVTIGGVLWRVHSVSDETLCWGLHLRRAGT